ncbi:hypothetical protein KY325_00030, partial [Candidatus Woesearchaeota archaeon]|nr:hypothetical protein [Candidatus Woesearchaeota archaeon]
TRAGADVGLETEVDHRYDLTFRLGDTVEEKQRYSHTYVYLRTKPNVKREDEVVVMIGRLNKNEPVNQFTMTPSCSRPKPEKMKAYLEAVLKYLKKTG